MSVQTGNQEIKAVALGCVAVHGQVVYGATGAVATGPDAGDGMTVARAAAGRYTVTFAAKFRKFLGMFVADDKQETATGARWEIFTPYSPSTGTITLSHIVGDATTDPAETDPVSGTTTDFCFLMSNTDLGVA